MCVGQEDGFTRRILAIHSDLGPELSNFINYVANSGALKTPLG